MVQILNAIDKLLVVHDDEAYCQPCVSPVWDTALAAHALMEAGEEATARVCARRACLARTAANHRCRRRLGRAKAACAAGRLGISICQSPLSRCRRHRRRRDGDGPRGRPDLHGPDYKDAIARAREWIEGLQSANGGWGAFDSDNDHDYLNYIPFADHGALLDPPTADVTARCLSLLGQLGETSGRQSRRSRAASIISCALRRKTAAGSAAGE